MPASTAKETTMIDAARLTVDTLLADRSTSVQSVAFDWLLGVAEFFGVPDQARVGLLLSASGVDLQALREHFENLV